MEHSTQCVAISWHSLVWFMDVRLPSYMIIMMMAILLSIVMDMAFEKNCKLLQTESLAGQALPLPAGTSGGRACHCLLILASQAAQYLESKMSRLCHTAMCHVCPQTIPLIHHWRQLLAVTSTLLMGSSVNAWWRFLRVSCYRAAALGPAAIRPQPVLSRAESCMHTASSLADWLLSRAAGKGQGDAVWLCIYIVIITLTAGLQADQTVCPN